MTKVKQEKKFHGLLDFIQTQGKLILPLLKAFVGITIAIHRKSTQTAKLFSHLAFVAYSIPCMAPICMCVCIWPFVD